MERIMKSQAYAKSKDPSQEFYAMMKKTFEINPRHPVIKELLRFEFFSNSEYEFLFIDVYRMTQRIREYFF